MSELKTPDVSLRQAALLAGIGYVMMFGTPFAEFYAMSKISFDGGAALLGTGSEQRYFLRMAIFGYTINFVGDILAAWGMYIILKPVNKSLSLLASWLRITYTVISMSALLNLVTILSITKSGQQYDVAFVNNQIRILFAAFNDGWKLAYIFFGAYLILMGGLIIRSGYIPKWIGAWVFLAGIGWLVNSLQPLLYPNFEINFTIIALAGVGELALMVWLFVKGIRLNDHLINS